MELFDSHCHLTDQRFDEDREEVLDRAGEAGVRRVVSIASDAADARAVATLAEANENVWGTAGIHPHEAGGGTEDGLREIRDLLARERIVAVGETGLDFYYDNSPREAQRRWFVRHLELATELELPVVVHSRSADRETADLIRDFAGSVQGVLHCFTGSLELLEAGLEADWYVSFSGIATFNGFDGGDAVRTVPADRLLVETDAPYLAPVPKRGKRNEPAFVAHVLDGVARLRGEEPEEVAARTVENTVRFYRLGG